MKHPILICVLFLSPAWLPVHADEVKSAEFPLSDERMVMCIDLAVDGNLTIPNVMAGHPDPRAREQLAFLNNLIGVRGAALLPDRPNAGPAERCCRAVTAARAGNYSAANILLEKVLDTTEHDARHGYCLLLYLRWNGRALSYRLLHWWSEHVSGPSATAAIVTLLCASQIVAIPLLLNLRRGIKAGRQGRALHWPAIAVGFAEFVPVCWAATNGPAWAVAYDMNAPGVAVVALLAHVATLVVFLICSHGVMSAGARAWLAVVILIFGPFLTVGPFGALGAGGLISPSGIRLGVIFWSTGLAVAIYFLLLSSRQRSGLA